MRARSQAAVGCCVVGLFSIASFNAAAEEGSRIVDAVKNRNQTAVQALIKHKVDVNAAEGDGTTALQWAVHWDDAGTVDLLVAAGARVDAANDYGMTALVLACRNGDPAIVRKLLKAGANPNLMLPSGQTPLMTAARTGNVDVVRMMLEQGAEVNVAEKTRGQTALMWAAAEGQASIVQTLLDHGASVHARSMAGFTSLLLAARGTDQNTVDLLMNAGARVNEAAADGTTPLIVATIRGHLELAAHLLDHGADPNLGPGFTPLHWAAGDWGAKLAGDKTRVKDEDSEWGALEGLPPSTKVDFMKQLLAHGAQVNRRAESSPRYSGGSRTRGDALAGATAFLIAAQNGDAPLMKFLVSEGADPLLRTSKNTTPLMAAAGLGQGAPGTSPVPENAALEAVKLCVKLGADINAVNADGETALHAAAYRGPQGSRTIVQFLVDNGANVNVKNRRGWSPLVIAEGLFFEASNTINDTTAKLLRTLGAEPSPANIERDATAVTPLADRN